MKEINLRKEKMIAERKLRKEKPLPAIKKEEIPFVLPEGWVWCRGGGTLLRGKSPTYSEDGTIGRAAIVDKNSSNLLYDSHILNYTPLAEQHTIVEKIESLMKSVDELETQVQERKRYAEDLLQSVLREAFEG
jgi:hypothetical protein